MAHTYTTARGKTKKAKEGIRKDAKNNAATKLMTKITQATPKSQEDVPIAKEFLNRLKSSSSGEAKQKQAIIMGTDADGKPKTQTTEEVVAQALQNIRFQLPSYQRCFSSRCGGSTQHGVFKLCSNCRIARYCSPECQKEDWHRAHKANCKKPDTLIIGKSVAIRPLETYLSSLPASLYPPSLCKSPCNEIHGIIVSIIGQETAAKATVEIFDSYLIPTEYRLEIALQDMIASGWELEREREFSAEKQKLREEQVKSEAKARAQAQKQTKAKESTVKPSMAVDWSLFEDRVAAEENVE